MICFLFVCVVAQFVTANGKAQEFTLPNSCGEPDSILKNCFLRNLKTSPPYVLKNELVEYLASFDPLKVSHITIEADLNEMTNLTGTFENAKVVGLSQYTVSNAKVDKKHLALQIDMQFPHIKGFVEMDVHGKVFGVPLGFSGYFTLNITNMVVRISVSFKTVNRESIKHLSLKKLRLNSEIAAGHFEVVSKDPQNQPLVDFAVEYFNRNSHQFLDFMCPYYLQMAEDYLGPVIETGLASVPAEKLVLG